MRIDEYSRLDAIDIALLIKEKQVSPLEILDMAIYQIEKSNPKYNAVVSTFYDLAKRQLQFNKEAPLYGVPILLKDSLHEFKNTRSTLGSRLLKGYFSKKNSTFVQRLIDAGCIILGKTNVPEFTLMGTTEPKLFGATRNPYNTEYSAGGSSGGSAAAVASGMVPVATANDGGGSIRIPASMCGLFGFKPSRYFTPLGNEFYDVWMGLVVNHVLTKSVRDSAFFLDVEYGFDGPISFLKPVESFYNELKKPLGRLRIAVNTNSYFGMIDQESIAATMKVAKMLENMGHVVEEASLDVDFESLYESYIDSMFIETSFLFDFLEHKLNKKITINDVEPSSFVLAKIGDAMRSKENIKIKHLWDKTAVYMREFHAKYHVYMTPTVAKMHIKLGELLPSKLEEGILKLALKFSINPITKIIKAIALKQLSYFPFTQIANQTGQPAMSLPFAKSSENVPIGVQFLAPYANDHLLLRLAKELEEALPWQK